MKKMKHIATLALAILLSTIAFGQKHHKQGERPTKEKIKALKIAHITSKLDLSPKESQQFWPIYNEFEAKMDATRKSMRKMHKKEISIDDLTDTEVEEMITSIDNARQKELDLHKEYQAKFRTILSIKKVAKLYRAEHSFKKDLLKKMRVKKGGPNELNIPPPPSRH